jgi:hypothetical protein
MEFRHGDVKETPFLPLRAFKWPSVVAALAAAALLVLSCGSNKKDGYSNPDDSFGSDGGAFGPLGDAACASVHEEGKVTPLNLFIMLDKSSSEVGTKWDASKAGLQAFVSDPQSSGVRVAIGFFPRNPDATPACDQNAYATPRVPFDVLPQNGSPIVAAVGQETPDGVDTPIYPALGGAILGAMGEAKARPGETGAVLLVTDGEPSGPAPTCGGVNPEDPAEIAKLAQAGVGQGVRTFVIGLPGVSSNIANQIAAAGNTSHAYIVTGTNLQSGFQDALNQVRGNALPCVYVLPQTVANRTIAYDKVNVDYTKLGAQNPEVIPQNGGCPSGAEGWSYDDPQNPQHIVLCPATCGRLKGDAGGKVEILLGCDTIVR